MKCVQGLNFPTVDFLQVFNTGETVGGGGEENKVGIRPLPVQTCVGETWDYPYICKNSI